MRGGEIVDREKANGFELCANGEPCTGEKFMKCPFSPRNNAEQNCGVTMARYAIELLKEQENDLRIMFNRCQATAKLLTSGSSCDACLLREKCERLTKYEP